MIFNKHVTAIILAAGQSKRFGKNNNKNFELINGKSILLYSIDAFNQNKYVDSIIIVTRPCDIENVKNIIEKKNAKKNIEIVLGGRTRQESVYNALKQTYSEIVIINDGARPAIKQEYIDNCLKRMNEYKGVTIGVKSNDTIKISDNNGIAKKTTNRNNTWIIQTPQSFDRNILLQLHEKYKYEEATDDCSLLEKENYKIKIIDGDYTNIKVTTYMDKNILENIFKNWC